MSSFEYAAAFSRNVGWVTAEEQARLRRKRIAIAGLGGVGGAHLLTLARLGVGAFHIADFDHFELPNFNRQAGATISTLGRPKADVLAEMAIDINPEIEISIFAKGVSGENLDTFLDGVDTFVDGLDFFAFDARSATFAACARHGVPAVTAAPLGMGAAVLTFLPGRMTFEEYFQFAGRSEAEQAIRFLVGLAPLALHRTYLVDRSAVDFAAQRGPSTIMACQICAGMAATETLKVLLGRGRLRAAPAATQFDAYRGRLVRTWRPGGNRHPLQKAAIVLARRQMRELAKVTKTPRRP
jgi:molybdopterin/thiamine biosynthesis adenylyltransferase